VWQHPLESFVVLGGGIRCQSAVSVSACVGVSDVTFLVTDFERE
jgi:hypothetical protein